MNDEINAVQSLISMPQRLWEILCLSLCDSFDNNDNGIVSDKQKLNSALLLGDCLFLLQVSNQLIATIHLIKLMISYSQKSLGKD